MTGKPFDKWGADYNAQWRAQQEKNKPAVVPAPPQKPASAVPLVDRTPFIDREKDMAKSKKSCHAVCRQCIMYDACKKIWQGYWTGTKKPVFFKNLIALADENRNKMNCLSEVKQG